MNVLFLSMAGVGDLDGQGIYGDLLKVFASHGHKVWAVSPAERRTSRATGLGMSHGITLLDVRTGNLQKCGAVEKGLSQVALGGQYLRAIRKHLPGVRFDLIIYPTPPTTLHGLVTRLKREHGAATYLLLKDIFPQNSLDLGMLCERGPKGLLYRYFKRSERKTYEVSDFIGCMSPANRDYLLAHEPWLNPAQVEVNPNSVTPLPVGARDSVRIRARCGFEDGLPVFVYGGNLGRPQGIGFLVECLRLNEREPVANFVVAGAGTERCLLEEYVKRENPFHARLLGSLPKGEYDEMIVDCDAGVVLLDSHFTIPNFPSRLLSYLQASVPVVVASDPVCDMGPIAGREGFGVACGSDDPAGFLEACARLASADMAAMGARGRLYLEENYTAERSYEIIMEHFND